MLRIEQSFSIDRPPEAVFDYLADPSNLSAWQSTGARIEQLTEGPPQLGTRFRERGKALGFIVVEQVSEITSFDRPRSVGVTVVEGPVLPLDGRYELEPQGAGTIVRVALEYGLTGIRRRILARPTRRVIARRLAGDHERLKRILETG